MTAGPAQSFTAPGIARWPSSSASASRCTSARRRCYRGGSIRHWQPIRLPSRTVATRPICGYASSRRSISAFGRWHAAAAVQHNWLFCQPRVPTTFAGSDESGRCHLEVPGPWLRCDFVPTVMRCRTEPDLDSSGGGLDLGGARPAYVGPRALAPLIGGLIHRPDGRSHWTWPPSPGPASPRRRDRVWVAVRAFHTIGFAGSRAAPARAGYCACEEGRRRPGHAISRGAGER